MEALLRAHPEAAQEKDNNGLRPLRMAAGTQAPLDVVKALLRARPEASQEKYNHGPLPLHMAVVALKRMSWLGFMLIHSSVQFDIKSLVLCCLCGRMLLTPRCWRPSAWSVLGSIRPTTEF